MNKISIPKWTACITIGMQKGYTDEKIGLKEIKELLSKIQEIQIEREKLFLSANVFLSDIVLSGQDEPHANVNFINYPRFPATEEKLKEGVLEIGKYLMDQLQQNRIVITFGHEVIVLEQTSDTDARIKKGQS